MARPVYSIGIYQGRNVTHATLEAPAGFVYVVRDIDAFFGGGAAGGALNVTGSEGQTFAYFPYTGFSSSAFSWRGRQVFAHGSVFGFVSGHGIDITISGYLLSLP